MKLEKLKRGSKLEIGGSPYVVTSATKRKIVLETDDTRLKEWMEKRKLTQRAAAEILGCGQSQVSKILNGSAPLTPKLAEKLK